MSMPDLSQPTVAAIGKGTTLGYGAVADPSYQTIAEIIDLKMPQTTVDKIKIQRYDSPDLYGEMIAGWREAGELEFDCVYNKDVVSTLFALLGTPQSWQITKPDNSTWTYVGFLDEFSDPTPLKDKMTSTFKFVVSGAPVFVIGS